MVCFLMRDKPTNETSLASIFRFLFNVVNSMLLQTQRIQYKYTKTFSHYQIFVHFFLNYFTLLLNASWYLVGIDSNTNLTMSSLLSFFDQR